MKKGFYPRLAIDGMRKNRRLYLPYLLTSAGMVMMHYIVTFLGLSDEIQSLRGGSTVALLMRFGSFVIAFFSMIFLFYTNAFLIRRRKREFGLYSVLGMNRKNLGCILFFENLFAFGFALIAGLCAGIAFSKLAELGLVNVVGGKVSGVFTVSVLSLLMSVGIFAGIFLLLFLNALRQVYVSSAVTLLRSESAGEKPPKGNPFLGILGVAVLIAAYGIAATVQNPITAMGLFFVAVLMVIAGTYLVMIAGSVLLCRILKKKKSYYYQPQHFVSVSSMAYRMKRNGAGLASVCILATMVLVMISSTSSLFFGAEDAVNKRYPEDFRYVFYLKQDAGLPDRNTEALEAAFSEAVARSGLHVTGARNWHLVSVPGLLQGENVETDPEQLSGFSLDAVDTFCNFYFIPLSDYCAATGKEFSLDSGEALAFSYRTSLQVQRLRFVGNTEFRLIFPESMDERLLFGGEATSFVTPSIVLVVPDFTRLRALGAQTDSDGKHMLNYRWIATIDTDSSGEEQQVLPPIVSDLFSREDAGNEYDITGYYYECKEENRIDFYANYGGLFYLGIFLSIVFIVATVLMIYYKQISEGYEDASRFEIMQKVGMTRKEIRRSINSQLLTVFFLPLVLAGIHLAFAFPMIRQILLLFNLSNLTLFGITTGVSFLIFSLFYLLVYRATSNAYFRIVSGAGQDAER